VSPPRRPPSTCGRCHQVKRCTRLILEQPVCQLCTLRFARAPQTCPGCGGSKVLAFYDTQRRPACAGCTGNPAVYGCDTCGREDSHWGRRCAPCVLAERATTLLSRPDGGVHPQLQPVYDALLAGPRPQTTLYWFDRSLGPDILRSMARGDLEISHATFEAMPTNRTNSYLRDLLAALGVLPTFHAELERVTPWLSDLLASLPKDHGDIIARYARWQVLRRLRHQDQAGTLSHGAISAGRASIVATARLLAWLNTRGTDIAAATQADIEEYAAEHYGRAHAVVSFLTWAHRAGLTEELSVPARQRDQPHVTLSDRDRWAHVELLLHDDTIRLYARIAGLFTLLFAQPLSRTCRMRADQTSTRTGVSRSASTPSRSSCPSPWTDSSCGTSRPAGRPLTPADPTGGSFPAGTPASTWPPRTSAASSSSAASHRAPPATPRCTSSPPRSPPRSWPRCSDSARTRPSVGPPWPPATGASTPPCDRHEDMTSHPHRPRPDLAQHQQHSTSDPAEPTMVRAPGHLCMGRGASG